MARFLRFSANSLRLLLPSPQNPNPSSSSSSSLLKTLTPSPRPLLALSPRSFLSDPGPSPSAFDDRLLRLLRSEISYLAGHLPPLPPPNRFRSFSVEDHPGEQWIRLRCAHGADEVKVDATMFDGAAAVPDEPLFKRVEAHERGPRLHISLVVEVSRGGGGDEGEGEPSVLEFICSAWPDSLVVHKVFPLRKKGAAVRPYMGRDFKELDAGDRRSVVEYLEERGVDDELAEFLHEYMVNKDKSELLRWLRIVESYVQK
ncbi:uncharacterized protein At2g39795, mitochondrial-like [Ananas comosus]|uniref:Uncharacterized protein At2g39795, mitochondrial-like n=2 Tax=Ananas comosus TaxID=4615 RepID=A0A6P5GJY2_ANACO|nr:uncharacterized protein At2g39795, mitochondrial-like [Ananas comosus]